MITRQPIHGFRDVRGLAFHFLLAILAIALPARAQLKVLHSFNGADGSEPSSPLILDSRGNLYGTTVDGGDAQQGTVFKLAPDGTESVVYSFHGSDGSWPVGLILARDGNFYGATRLGGPGGFEGNGTVFKLTPEGVETVLYSFSGQADGREPMAGVVMDAQGNLYGTTYYGGDAACGSCGVVFKVAPDGTETVVHAFTGKGDGANSTAGLVFDGAGNLYGTTTYGGKKGWGMIFELAPDGTETILYNFVNTGDGANPDNTLVFDQQGNLYGTTVPLLSSPTPYGTVFKFTPSSGTLTTLYAFGDGNNGAYPYGPLTLDGHASLYGTTFEGLNGHSYHGTVFRLTPKGKLKTLHHFERKKGTHPNQGVTIGPQGTLYGTNSTGGLYGSGTVFSLMP